MQQILGDVLKTRMNKACAIILAVKERECDRHLPPDAQSKLRKVVLDQMNDYYDLCIDIMRSLDTGDVVLNEEYLKRLDRKLDEIHLAVISG